jgi:putative ABC transport system permease protein
MILGKMVALNLAFKEIWRNKGRFFLISLVIALITLLVIFLAGLGEGLAAANKEYLSKVDADLIIFQEKADRSVIASQLGRSIMNDVQRTPGVSEAAAIGYSSVFLDAAGAEELLGVSMLGVEPGKPGSMEILEGRQLGSLRANEAVIGSNVASSLGLAVGDTFVVEATQGTVDERFELTVVGISGGQQFFFAPSITVPLQTWERIRPKAFVGNSQGELVFNIIALTLENPAQWEEMGAVLQQRVGDIDPVDLVTAYESTPAIRNSKPR